MHCNKIIRNVADIDDGDGIKKNLCAIDKEEKEQQS